MTERWRALVALLPLVLAAVALRPSEACAGGLLPRSAAVGGSLPTRFDPPALGYLGGALEWRHLNIAAGLQALKHETAT